YIPHLLNDIASAQRPEATLKIFSTQTFEEEMEAIERWVAGKNEHEHTFGYYCGLCAEEFPPVEQLSINDMKSVCKAFEQLLFSWNSDIDLPDALPVNLRYRFMINTLNEGFTPVNSGSTTFDYCNGYAPDCVFGKYCSCLKMWNEDNNTEEQGNE
ncbi:MAG: hypothetical protein ACRDE2_07460, partial [Chitinophagaceae bacterium]